MKKKSILIPLLSAALLLSACTPSGGAGGTEAATTEALKTVQEPVSEEKGSQTESPKSTDQENETITPESESVTPEAPDNGSVTPEASEEETLEDGHKPPVQFTLTGNRDDHFISEEFCYLEDEKFFLLVEPGADLPGDFAVNVGLIIDKLEEVSGLSYTIDTKLCDFDNSSVQLGYNPWEDMEYGYKVPVFIMIDEKANGYISSACAEWATIYMFELYSDEVWNAVPEYRDNPERRYDWINYYQIAHELTHTLTLRQASMTKIMTEGIADYYAEKAINALADVSPDFAGSVEIMSWNLDDHVKEDVTPENAEAVFRNDYSDLSHTDRGDEYTLGRMIGLFLEERYGKDFMKDYLKASQDAGYKYPTWYDLEEDDRNKLADEFKKLFGDDVFTDFGEYYQTHAYQL